MCLNLKNVLLLKFQKPELHAMLHFCMIDFSDIQISVTKSCTTMSKEIIINGFCVWSMIFI